MASGGGDCDAATNMSAKTDLRTLLAKASPLRSGDQLGGVAGRTYADVPSDGYRLGFHFRLPAPAETI